jgi:hypothetical protein
LAIVGKFHAGQIICVAKDLSSKCQSAKLTLGKEVFDLTVFGNAAKVRAAIGLEDHSLALSFLEDLAATEVYATLYGMWVTGTGTVWHFKLDAEVDSATSPRFTCSYILANGQLPIGGQHGQLLKTDVTLISTSVMTFDVA